MCLKLITVQLGHLLFQGHTQLIILLLLGVAQGDGTAAGGVVLVVFYLEPLI
jgi:hypothetical protein